MTLQKKKSCSILALVRFLNSKAETLVSDSEGQTKMELVYVSYNQMYKAVVFFTNVMQLNKMGTLFLL